MKRKWRIWLLIASACLIVVFVVSGITGISIVGILGLGVVGVVGVVAIVYAFLMFAAIAPPIVYLIATILSWLLESFIHNRKAIPIIMGILGFLAVMIGYFTSRFSWSLLLVMVGFGIGCIAGADYRIQQLELGAKWDAYKILNKFENAHVFEPSLLKRKLDQSELATLKKAYEILENKHEYFSTPFQINPEDIEAKHLLHDLYKLESTLGQMPELKDYEEEEEEEEGKRKPKVENQVKGMSLATILEYESKYKDNKNIMAMLAIAKGKAIEDEAKAKAIKENKG